MVVVSDSPSVDSNTSYVGATSVGYLDKCRPSVGYLDKCRPSVGYLDDLEGKAKKHGLRYTITKKLK
eukprot:SAG22_NODE_1070_length_5723_cov_2.407539_3_plen_67_part_00